MIKLEEIREPERLWKIREEWENLLSVSDGDDLFLHPDWLLPWLKVFGKGCELVFIALWEEARLVALFPLCRRRVGPFRIITFAGSPVSDRMDFILLKGEEEACLDVFVKWLMTKDGWDKVILDNFGAFSKSPEILNSLLEETGNPYQWLSASRYYYVPAGRYASFEEYMKKNKTKKSLKHLRNYRNKLLRREGAGWRVLKNLDAAALEKMIWIDTVGSYRGESGNSFFGSSANLRFFMEVYPGLQKTGWLEIFVFESEGEIHAYEINFLYRNRLLSYQASFEKAFSRHSLGTVTCFEAIRHAFSQGYAEYDFLLGDEAYKNHWSNQFRQGKRLQIYRGGLLSRGLRVFDLQIKPPLKHLAKSQVSEWAFSRLRSYRERKERETGLQNPLWVTPYVELALEDSLEGLAGISEDWKRLNEGMEIADPFLHPSWIDAWARSFNAEDTLFFVTCRVDRELSGVIPLCFQKTGGFHTLIFAGSPVSDRMDFIVKEPERGKVFTNFWQWLSSQRFWDMMILNNLCARTDTPEAVRDACDRFGMKLIEIFDDACFYIDLGKYGGYEEYLKATFNRKHRNFFRRLNKKRKKVFPDGAWEVEHGIDNALLREIAGLDRLRSLRGKAGRCFFKDDRHIRFMENLAKDRYFQEITHVLTFRAGRKLLAYLLFFSSNNRFLAYQTAFDMEFRDLSLGTQLFLESIRYAFENHYIEYDFLKGDEDFKKRFTGDFRKTKAMLIFSDTPKGKILYAFYKGIRPTLKRVYQGIRTVGKSG